ncbi:hypothetical protein BKA57DRAFT_189516 [Linnemannia elongata]|nr:hypothetical protein BKA57DRAFT_189516 [Linnemannia elongata]
MMCVAVVVVAVVVSCLQRSKEYRQSNRRWTDIQIEDSMCKGKRESSNWVRLSSMQLCPALSLFAEQLAWLYPLPINFCTCLLFADDHCSLLASILHYLGKVGGNTMFYSRLSPRQP